MQTWEHVLTRAREDVSFTDVKIKIPEKDWPVDVNDVMHRKHARRILGILKRSLSWELDTEREVSTFGARRGQTNLRATGAARDEGANGKARIERMCISLSYVETFNAKVIKGFVPELRSRFGIPMFSVYMLNIRTLWTFCVPVWICPFPVFISGYGTGGLFVIRNTIKFHFVELLISIVE